MSAQRPRQFGELDLLVLIWRPPILMPYASPCWSLSESVIVVPAKQSAYGERRTHRGPARRGRRPVRRVRVVPRRHVELLRRQVRVRDESRLSGPHRRGLRRAYRRVGLDATLAGVALGAVPLVAVTSVETDIPYVIARKQAKEYGTGNRIEGDLTDGEEVIILEDIATTGQSAVDAAEALREAGAVVNRVLVVVDREEGASVNLADHDLELSSLVTDSTCLPTRPTTSTCSAGRTLSRCRAHATTGLFMYRLVRPADGESYSVRTRRLSLLCESDE